MDSLPLMVVQFDRELRITFETPALRPPTTPARARAARLLPALEAIR